VGGGGPSGGGPVGCPWFNPTCAPNGPPRNILMINTLVNHLNLNTAQASWVSTHPRETGEIYGLLIESLSDVNRFTNLPYQDIFPDYALTAAKITIMAAIANQIVGPYNQNHFTNYVAPNLSLSQSQSVVIANYFLNFTVAKTKITEQHPEWSTEKIYLEATEYALLVEDGNLQEKALVALFPAQGYAVYANSKKALTKAQEWATTHPGNTNSLTDGRADAMRHSYWNALNTSDIGVDIAKLFADAHEYGATRPSSIPQDLWDLQREMDLHNNQVGRNISALQGWGIFTSSTLIWNYFVNSYINGNLLILKYICKETVPFSLRYMYELCP
jgi:hypothetical protein